jgi:hypothetical protein
MQMYSFINQIGELKLVSDSSSTKKIGRSLDPIDWSTAGCIAHQALDASLVYLKFTRDRLFDNQFQLKFEKVLKENQFLKKVNR